MRRLAPYWMVAMWGLLAIALNVSLRWLRGRWWLAAVLGAVGGPVSFASGVRLGAAHFVDAAAALAAIAVAWALALPLLMWLSDALRRRSLARSCGVNGRWLHRLRWRWRSALALGLLTWLCSLLRQDASLADRVWSLSIAGAALLQIRGLPGHREHAAMVMALLGHGVGAAAGPLHHGAQLGPRRRPPLPRHARAQ